MKAVARGTFRTLVHDDNQPVSVVFQSTVSSPPRLSNGKMYATVVVNNEDAFQENIFVADKRIKEIQQGIEYSPLLSNGQLLVIKLAANALADHDLAVCDTVEIHMKLGSFGKFGYCWNFRSRRNLGCIGVGN